MEFDTLGLMVSAFAVLLTGISKAGLGGALGGLAVPFMSLWVSPSDAVAIMLPILIAMDLYGLRAWKGQANWQDLKILIPSAFLGVVFGSLLFGVMSEQAVKLALGFVALVFSIERLLPKRSFIARPRSTKKWFGVLCGASAGMTSTLAHAGGPPVMIYLLSKEQPRATFVATTVFFFTAINLAKLPFYIGLGLFSLKTLRLSLIFLPLVPLGVWCGMLLLKKIPERPFFIFSTLALGVSGVKLLWDGLA